LPSCQRLHNTRRRRRRRRREHGTKQIKDNKTSSKTKGRLEPIPTLVEKQKKIIIII